MTGGPPVLPAGLLPSLVDEAGMLPRRPEGLSGVDPGEVMAEVRAQFDRFLKLTGRLPTHLDGHHHSHQVPAVLDAVVAIARENELPVRDAGAGIRARLEQAEIPTTDLFVNRFYGDEVRLDALLHRMTTFSATSFHLNP